MNRTLNVLVPDMGHLSMWNNGTPIGHGIDLWKFIVDLKKIKYKFSPTSRKDMFNTIQNTTTNDVLIMDTYINYDRHKVMGHSLPYAMTSAAFFSQRTNNCGGSETLLPTLTIHVFTMTFVIFCLVTMILAINKRREKKRRFKSSQSLEIVFNLLDCLRVLLRQSLPRLPKLISGRIAVISLIIGMLFLMLSYQNEMKVNMALCTGSAPDTIEQVFQLFQNSQGRKPWLVIQDLLKTGTFEPWKGLSSVVSDFKLKRLIYMSYENNVFRDFGKLCLGENKNILNTEVFGLRLHVGRTKYFMQPIYLATRLGLPKDLVEYIDGRVLNYLETGLRQYVEKKRWFILENCFGPYFYSGSSKNDFNTAEMEGLDLSGVGFCFLFWIIALFVSLAVLFFELFYHFSNCFTGSNVVQIYT